MIAARAVLCAAMAACAYAGDLTARFDLTVNRIVKGGPPVLNDDFVLADAVPRHERRFTNFSGDVSGRYIGAMAMASRYSGAAYPALDRIVTKILPLQKPDGHFGDPFSAGEAVTSNDMAILWGNGRLLIGLLEYYSVSKRADALAAARRLGDFFVKVSPVLNSEAVRKEYNGEKFAVGYICWTQTLEGLAELYRVTRDGRYLQLAKEIAARTDRHPSQHSHGFLTSVRGLVALYRVDGRREYLEQAEREWQGVVDSGNLLTGGAVPEMFAPRVLRDEGCSEADWLRLSIDLWQATRNPKYLDAAERTLFNEFSFNQFHTGDFGHHTFSPNGYGPAFARAWWCCTFHGLRAMVDAFGAVFHEQDGVLWYDLTADGRAAGVTAASHLEQDGAVTLTFTRSARLRVRRPEWAENVTISKAGGQGYGYVEASVNPGETITITYTMRTRVERNPKRRQAYVTHGPWLMAVDETASPNYFDEPMPQNRVALPPEPASGEPVSHLRVRYLPGGYAMQPATALLRPIAEHTRTPDGARIEWWLPLDPEKEVLDSNYTVKK